MNKSKDDHRRTLSNYFESKETLNEIMNTIGYRIFDNNGNHWGLSTNGHFDEYFNQYMLSLCKYTYKEELIKVINKKQSLFLRVGQPNSFNPFHTQLYSKGIWNIIAYYRKSTSFVEGYYFCGVNPEESAKLINSIDYVNDISKEISRAVNKKIKIYDSKLDFSFSNPLINFRSLSEREKICLINYAFGKSIKQISNALSLSPRTIETYIIRSKNKLEIRSKEEIVEFLLQFFSNMKILEFLRFSSN